MEAARLMLVVGGSGFIGTHVCERFEGSSYDLLDGNDAHNLSRLTAAMAGCETVVHLASNADIAASAENPTLDFDEGTVLTRNVCEAARLGTVKRIIYASGSGVYGDLPKHWHGESESCVPVSPYGASKVAGEALVSAYCHMYGMRGVALRLANVVGPGQTHGVGFDFVRKLRLNPNELMILGDGQQTKSYVAVTDVLDAVDLFVHLTYQQFLGPPGPFAVFNVASEDTMTVKEIADMACEVLNVSPRYFFTGGVRGWPGDVPVVRLATAKLRSLGWRPTMGSAQAMRWALESM